LARSAVGHHAQEHHRAFNSIVHAMQDSNVARNQITAASAAAADNKHSGKSEAKDLTVKKGLGSELIKAKGEQAQPVEISCNENESGVIEYGGQAAEELTANRRADEEKKERAYMQGQLGIKPLVGTAKLVEYNDLDEDEVRGAEVVAPKAQEVQGVPEETVEVRQIYETAKQ
jgi:hypothetical protein